MNPWKGLEGLPRAMWVLALSTLVNRLGTVVVFFLALYLVQGRGWTESQAALAMAVYGAGSLVASPFSGWVADRWGHRTVLGWSLGLSAAFLLCVPYAPARGLLLALVGLWSLTNQAFWPSSMALITDLVPPERRKQAFVLHRLASNLGIAVGPALGGFIAHHSYPALFWIDAATTFAGLGVLLAGVRVPPGHAQAGPPSPTAWRDRRLLLFLLALVPALVTFTQIHGIFSLWVSRDLGHGPSRFGLLFTFNTLVILLLEAALNHRLAHWTHGRQLALGALLLAAGFATMGLVRPMSLLALCTLVWTFGEMVFLPASSDAVAGMSPPDRRGQYLGLYSLTWTVAMTVGPWLGLTLYGRFRPPYVWGAMGALALVTALAVHRFKEHPAGSAIL